MAGRRPLHHRKLAVVGDVSEYTAASKAGHKLVP